METKPDIDSNQMARVVQVGSTEEEVLRAADPEASAEEITASMSSCVVHLCGCK